MDSALFLNRAVFLGGPTGVGKSEFAFELASRINGEIVGADAFQIYSGLRLLTAQPKPEYLAGIPHWMIACVSPQESYNAARYQKAASQRIEEILNRGKVPVVVGGTGLYFRALIQGLDVAPASDPLLRRELEQLSLSELKERLVRADPTALARIDKDNPRRLLRAIEICELSGRPLKDFQSSKGPISASRSWFLMREREELHSRIAANVKRMWEEGVVEEVKFLRGRMGQTACRAIGFRAILEFLEGRMTEAQCQAAICLSTRQYAKRQLTWFRHQTTFYPLNLSAVNSTPLAVAALLAEVAASSKTSFSGAVTAPRQEK